MRSGAFLAITIALAAAPAAASPYADAVSADAPVAWWRFEELAGPSAASSAGSFTGTFANVALGQASFHPNLGSAGGFDGLSSSVDLPAIGSFTNLSIEAWVNPTALVPIWTALYNTDLFNADSSHWQFFAPGAGGAASFEWALGFGDLDNSVVFGTSNWYHIVTTYDAATGAGLLYVNGALVQTMFTVPGMTTNLSEGYLGAWNGNSRFFAGLLDEVAVYDTTLPANRIGAHYFAAAIATPEPAGVAVLLTGLAGIAAARRHRRRDGAAT